MIGLLGSPLMICRLAATMPIAFEVNATTTFTDAPGAIEVGRLGLEVMLNRPAFVPVRVNALDGSVNADVPVLVMVMVLPGLAPLAVGSLKTICDLLVASVAPGVMGRSSVSVCPPSEAT